MVLLVQLMETTFIFLEAKMNKKGLMICGCSILKVYNTNFYLPMAMYQLLGMDILCLFIMTDSMYLEVFMTLLGNLMISIFTILSKNHGLHFNRTLPEKSKENTVLNKTKQTEVLIKKTKRRKIGIKLLAQDLEESKTHLLHH